MKCNRTFFMHGVSPMLTVNCPNCGALMSIRELFAGGCNLIMSGLRMLDNCVTLIGYMHEYGGSNDAEPIMLKMGIVRRIIHEVMKEFPSNTTIEDIDDDGREWIRDNREQDAYFEKTPMSNLSKGNVHGQADLKLHRML